MLLSGVGLLLLGGALALNHFEIDGHFSSISVEEVQANPLSRSHFATSEERLRQRLFSLFNGNLHDFYIHSFAIHGEDLHPSAIFTAFFSSSFSRSDLIQLISAESDLDVFRVRLLPQLPAAPEFDTTNSTAATFCSNGGFLLPNSTCSCPHFFSGINCEIVDCHDGILDQGRCICPPGAYGLNCEPRGCLPPVQSALDVAKQSFILVINQKSSMAYVLNQVANLLGPTLNGFFASSRYDNFIVVNYIHTRNALTIQTNAFATISEMVDYLNTVVYSVQGVEPQPTNRAALAAQSFYPYMKALSIVYVFVDSLDEDAGPAEFTLAANNIENQLILRTIAWRNRIVYFFSEPSPRTDHSNDGNGFDTFHRVAKATLGDLYNYLASEVDIIIDLIGNYQGTETIAAVYDVTNSLNLDVKIPGTKDDGEATVLITVPSGPVPRITDSNRKSMILLSNGTRYAMYLSDPSNPFVILHSGGTRVNVRVWVNSVETIFLASSENSFSDTGFTYLSASYSNVIVGLPTEDQKPPMSLQWVSSTTQNVLSDKRAGMVRPALDCTYPITFGTMMTPDDTSPLRCTPGALIQHITFTASSGTMLTRLIPGYCLDMEKILPSFQCMNGGTRAGGVTCRCTNEWQGNQCQIPNCFNGGSINPFPGNGNGGPCSCLPGFSGDHCSILNCTTPSSTAFPPPTTTLALVLQSSLSQAYNGPSVEAGVATLLKAMQGKDQYDQFILTTFSYQRVDGNENNVITTSSFSTPNAFQTAVNNIKYLPTPSTTQDPLAALLMTLSNTSFYNSALFLVVDSQPRTITAEPDVLKLAVKRNVPINVILSPPFGMMEKCPTFSNIQFYEQLAIKTGGVIMNLCQKMTASYLSPIHDLFVGYAASHHKTEIINENYFNDFEVGPNLFFSVDQPGNDVFLIVNCPRTEKVDTKIKNYDLRVDPYVYPLVIVPFVGVYKVPTSAVNVLGYLATITRETSETSDGPCFLQALIKSRHSTILRFAPNPSVDSSDDSLEFAVPLHPVVHVNNDKINRTYLPVLSANDDKDRSFEYHDYPLTRTNSCSFEFWFNAPFTCGKPSDSFTLRFSGKTLDGNSYMRSLRGFCYLQSGKCANGGYTLSNGICKCPPNYGGLYCQSPKCQNGVLELDDFSCVCNPKYTGTFCESTKCDSWNYMESVDPRNNAPKEITFVLNRNADTLLVNIQLSNILQSIITATQASSSVPIVYTLITYDQFTVQRIISTSHADQFVQTFQWTVNNIQKVSASYTMSIDALVEAWKLNIAPPGIVYLFLGTPSMVPGPNAFDNYLEQKINTQVNVFYIPQNQGPYPLLPIDQQTSVLYQAVQQSGGRVLTLTQNSVSQLAPLIVSSTKHKELISEDGLQRCTKGCLVSVDIESKFKTVEFTIAGIDVAVPGNVVVKTDMGVVLPVNSDSTLFSDNQVLVLRFNNSQSAGGTWNLTATASDGGVIVQTRVDSDFRLYPGFTISKFDDFVHQIPFTGLGLNRSTYMSFRLVDDSNNLDNSATIEHVKVYRTSFIQPTVENTLVDSLYVYPRDFGSCAYQYISSEWVVDISTQQKFVVAGADMAGFPFKRTFFYQFPTFSQRAATCIHGQHDQYGQCVCQPNWSGDYCSDPICRSGGTTSYGICICVNGFYGQFCENHVTI